MRYCRHRIRAARLAPFVLRRCAIALTADPGLIGDHATPSLVGRERELAVLRQHLDAALAGHGSLVLIGGEAGIGKTSLAEAVGREAVEAGALVLVGRCYDLTETPPYGPWVELFGRYRHVDGPPLPASFAQRGTVGEVISQVALFQQVEGFFSALSARQPLVLLLEDMHWGDAASLDLLRSLARTLTDRSILLLGTYRADELARHHPLYALLPTLMRESRAARLDLQPLTDNAVRAVVAARYALSDADTTRLVTYLQGRAEGNPFFLGELLRALEEGAILRVRRDGAILDNLTDVRLPSLLQQVIESRVERLGEDLKELLRAAAIIGQEVTLALWASVAGVDEEIVLNVVERAVAAHMLAAMPDGTRVRFTHALIREALYEGMLPPRRRRMHQRIGDALIATGAPDPDIMAYHLQQAGDARAAAWLINAGTRARLSYAFVTAAARYEGAIALMKASHAASSERGWVAYLLANTYFFTATQRADDILSTVIDDAAHAGDEALEALARYQRSLIRWGFGISLVPVNDMVAAMRVLEGLPAEQMTRIRQYLGPQYSLDDDRAGVVRALCFAGRFAEALPIAEYLVRGGRDTRTYSYASGAEALSLLFASRGKPDEARRWGARAHDGYAATTMYGPLVQFILFEIFLVHLPYWPDMPEAGEYLLREAAEIEALAQDSGLTGFCAAAALPALILHGAWSTAKQQAQIVSTSPLTPTRVFAIHYLALLAWRQGEQEKIPPYVTEMLPAGPATEPGTVRFHHGIAMQRLAAAHALDADDRTTAKAWLEAHDRWLAWSGAVLGQSEGQALWAEYYRRMGDTERAYTHAERSLAHATTPRQPVALLTAHRLIGELDIDAGRFDDAAAHLDQSLALADACQAPYERALTLLACAELRATTGSTTDAATLINEIRALCTPLGAKPALARTDVLTARLSPDGAVIPVYLANLTPREVEVLRLLAVGRTNREIADALFLSSRTVQVHITHILTKTHADNRTAAAAFALRHGLA